MAYKVIHKFKDLIDNDYIYSVGDIYPHEGVKIEDVAKNRIKELSSKKNKIGEVLIKEEKETTEETGKEDEIKEDKEESVEEEKEITEE